MREDSTAEKKQVMWSLSKFYLPVYSAVLSPVLLKEI